jgi:hypothetical protein
MELEDVLKEISNETKCDELLKLYKEGKIIVENDKIYVRLGCCCPKIIFLLSMVEKKTGKEVIVNINENL